MDKEIVRFSGGAFKAMPDTGIPENIERFIATQISSLEQLEVLLLLSESPEKWWTPQAVNDVVRSSEASVQGRLSDLAAKGWLERNADQTLGYRFAPETDELRKIIAELAVAYKERRLRVVQLVYSQPPNKAAEEFAAAFRLRKDS